MRQFKYEATWFDQWRTMMHVHETQLVINRIMNKLRSLVNKAGVKSSSHDVCR